MAETPYTSMRMLRNTEFLLRIIHCVNQLCFCGAVLNWCEQFGLTEEDTGQERIRDQRCIDKCETTRSTTFGITSKAGIGKQLARKHSGLRIADRDDSVHKGLRRRIVPHRVSAGMNCKTRPDEDDGFEQIIPLCREYTHSRVRPQSRAFAAIPGGTNIGPVIEVQKVKMLDQYGLEIAIPSTNDRERTSYVMISRGKSRFVDKVHISNAELRSGAELLTELRKAEGGESCLGQSNTGIQQTGAAHVSSHT